MRLPICYEAVSGPSASWRPSASRSVWFLFRLKPYAYGSLVPFAIAAVAFPNRTMRCLGYLALAAVPALLRRPQHRRIGARLSPDCEPAGVPGHVPRLTTALMNRMQARAKFAADG
jgi:hypothetical protein